MFTIKLFVIGFLFGAEIANGLLPIGKYKRPEASLLPLSNGTSRQTVTVQRPSEPFVYKSYQNSVYCTPSSPILYPRSGEELQELVRNAYETKQTVKILGGLYSITDIICTDGLPISTRFLNRTQINSDQTVTMESGAQLSDAMEILQSANLSLPLIPTFGGITIGGATGTGAHGSSLRHPGALSDQIVSVTLVDGTGKLRTITEADGDDFKAVGVHLGMMGAIINITLRTVPLFKMRIENKPHSEEILFDGTVITEAREYDAYQLWWFPHSKQVVISRGNFTNDLTVEGDASINLIPALSSAQISASHFLLERMQASKDRSLEYQMEEFSAESLHKRKLGKPPFFSEFDKNGKRKFVNPATGYGHKLMASRCTGGCIWENGRYSVRPEESAMAFEINELTKVVRTIRRILEQHPTAFPLIGVFIRFTKPSNNLMSIGSGRENVHIEWASPMRRDPYSTSKSGIAAYQAILQAMIVEHNGRPHWGKNGAYFFSQSILQSQAPNLQLFQNITKKYDPQGIFINKFGRRLLLQSGETTIDPKVKHCALQDYCMCSSNTDCARGQVCREADGGYNVCEDAVTFPVSEKILPKMTMDDLGVFLNT